MGVQVEEYETTTTSGVVEVVGGRHVLVELRSGDPGDGGDLCAGGFLAHATQIGEIFGTGFPALIYLFHLFWNLINVSV